MLRNVAEPGDAGGFEACLCVTARRQGDGGVKACLRRGLGRQASAPIKIGDYKHNCRGLIYQTCNDGRHKCRPYIDI